MKEIKLNFELIENEKEKDMVINVLMNGVNSPFWEYIEKVLDYNIKAIGDKILSEVDMSEIDNKVYKLYLQSLKDLKNSPQKHLLFLRDTPENDENSNADEDECQKGSLT